MRILVISDLPQFVTGGAEMQASRLIEAWADQGHEVICLGRRMSATQVRLGRHLIPTKRIWTLQWLGRPGRAVSYVASLIWHLLALRKWPDVIYSRFLGDAAATVAIAKAFGLLDVPLVPTPANAGPSGDISYLKSIPGSRILISLLDEQCDSINLIAPAMQADLRAAGFTKAPLTTIPNGVPLLKWDKLPQTGPLRALCVGRLAEQKGYDVLIEALGMLPAEAHSSIRVEIVGGGPLESMLRSSARKLPEGLLTFAGELPPAQVKKKMDDADIFLLPSRYEGMSNAGLEAWERGLPLLLTRCGGLDAYVTERTGWVVEPGNPKALAAALVQALATERSNLEAMGRACRSMVEGRFSMTAIAGRYAQLFEGLVHARRNRHT